MRILRIAATFVSIAAGPSFAQEQGTWRPSLEEYCGASKAFMDDPFHNDEVGECVSSLLQNFQRQCREDIMRLIQKNAYRDGDLAICMRMRAQERGFDLPVKKHPRPSRLA